MFVFVREPLKDEKAEDEKAALKDEIRNEEAGRENPQVRTTPEQSISIEQYTGFPQSWKSIDKILPWKSHRNRAKNKVMEMNENIL